MIKGFEMELIKRQIDKYIRLCGIKRKAEIKIIGQECKFSTKSLNA